MYNMKACVHIVMRSTQIPPPQNTDLPGVQLGIAWFQRPLSKHTSLKLPVMVKPRSQDMFTATPGKWSVVLREPFCGAVSLRQATAGTQGSVHVLVNI